MTRARNWRPLVILATLSLSPACDCGASEPAFTGAPPPAAEPAPRGDETIPGAVDARALAPATRSDLPAATPAITVVVEGRRLVVTNEALVATWPPGDRERLAAAPRPGAPERWPAIRVEVELPEDAPLRVPALVEALTAALDAERARSGAGAPTAVALRITGVSPWLGVERALYAAGMAGLSEPRLVLSSGRDEVELRLPLPRTRGAALTGPLAGRDPAEVVAAIQGALAQARGAPVAPGPPRAEVAPAVVEGASALEAPRGEPPTRDASRVLVALGADGLTVVRGEQRLGAGCQRPAIGPMPSLPSASISRQSVRDCLLVAGATSHPYGFEAEPEITFARIAPILEVLDEIGTVSIGMRSADTSEAGAE
ncbi:MAG: hypothetical protein ACK6CU_22470 [Deltaproteobacteria bacterium]|jgi:hypothetical protein